jgi:DNA primase catalytic subunit
MRPKDRVPTRLWIRCEEATRFMSQSRACYLNFVKGSRLTPADIHSAINVRAQIPRLTNVDI